MNKRSYRDIPRPDMENIWPLIDRLDFKTVIDLYKKSGIHDEKMGEELFSLVDPGIKLKKYETVIKLLSFLTQALEDPSELPVLHKKIGDVHSLNSRHDLARENYGKLPLTIENINLCIKTFIPNSDVKGLLSLRDSLLLRIPAENHEQMHDMIDGAISSIVASNPAYQPQADLFEKNKIILKTFPPFSECSTQTNPLWAITQDIGIVEIDNTVYIKNTDVWGIALNRTADVKRIKPLGGGSNIMVNCSSIDSLDLFLQRILTNSPCAIKHECRVIVDFSILLLGMRFLDLSSLQNCNYFIRFIDSRHLKEQLTSILKERKLPFTNSVIYLSKDDPSYFEKDVIPLLKTIEEEVKQIEVVYEKKLTEIYTENHQKTIYEKIKSGEKLKILFFTSRYTTYMQYAIRDMAEGFKKLGHDTFIEIEDADSGVSIRKDVCLGNLVCYKPDIIFTINHFRSHYPWVPEHIPFVTWVQDMLPHILGFNQMDSLTKNDYIFSFSQKWINIFFRNHPVFRNKKIHLLPITVDHKIYKPLPSVEKKFGITFISHLPHINQTFYPVIDGQPVEETYSENALHFIRQVVEDFEGLTVDKLHPISSDPKRKEAYIKEICSRLHIPLCSEFEELMANFDHQKNRSRFLSHILFLMKAKPIKTLLENNIDVCVYGANWEKVPIFKEIAKGPILNGDELNQVYNQSCINLNLSPGTSYHMKAPEVIASKSFMLTRRIMEHIDTMPITTFFKSDKEIVFFDNELDLLKKTKYFLSNPQEREKIVSAAYKAFFETLTVDRNAETVLDTIRRSV